jgi:UDP-GlcNAc:undecaprenyl-phosphate GlcNAc-1-phosphate transferase
MRGIRQSIRDQIHARDVAQVVAGAESIEHIQAILHDNAGALGLLYATVCRESSPVGGRGALPPAVAAGAWKLDCPVELDHPDADPYVLRVWTEAPDDLRLLTADRTARVLAAAVRGWLTGPRTPPRPASGVAVGPLAPAPSGASAA